MSILANRTVLVTGGAGFVGQHVCKRLEAFHPAAIVAPSIAEYDLREPAAIREMLGSEASGCDHPSGRRRRRYWCQPRESGPLFLRQSGHGRAPDRGSAAAQVQKVVSIGTICSYPKHTPVPFKEADLWNGYPEETNAPYGLAKKMLIVQSAAYRAQYGFNAVTLLPVNMYGPGDNFEPRTSHVIPALIRKVLEAQEADRDSIEVWGTGAASREFLFVRDAAEAICLATDRYNEPDPVNIGSGSEIHYPGPRRVDLRTVRLRGPDPLGYQQTGRPTAPLPGYQPRTREIRLDGHNRACARGCWKRLPGTGNSEPGVQPATREDRSRARSGIERITVGLSASPDQPAVRQPGPQSSSHARPVGEGRRALITGITGQDGSYLAELLLEKGYEVHGLIRRSSSFNTGRINHIYQDPHDPQSRLFLHYADLTDGQGLTNLVLDLEPDEVYNLGAQSHVRVSFDQPVYTFNSVALGALNILEAARQLGKRKEVRVYQASSSEMFGDVLETPQTEKTPFRPAESLRLRQGLRVSSDGQLPPGLRPVRHQRHPLQSRVSPAWRDVRHAENHACRDPHQIGSAADALPRQSRRQTGLGLCQGLRGSDVADAAAS